MENRKYDFEYCLIGNPVSHSLSPVIHNTITKQLGLNGLYGLNRIEKDLDLEISKMHANKILGINVTVPYKRDICKLISYIDPVAEAIGAVNTLKWTEKGYEGFNTDYLGLGRELTENGISLTGEKVCLIGAGGAARAAAFLAGKEKAASLTIINRTKEKAQVICDDIMNFYKNDNIIARAIGYEDINTVEDGSIAIQCTKIGMHPDVNGCVVNDSEFYSKLKYGVDLIYTPAETMFMINCRNAGVQVINGLEMLLYQAVESYELWRGVEVPDTAIKIAYSKLLEGTKHSIVLIGCMGAGKSSVGRELSMKYKMPLVDTDRLIEKNQGMRVSQIFEKYGEAYFRDLEHKCIKKLADDKSPKIISVGGGLPMREDNRNYLKKSGIVIYLRASDKALAKRLANDRERPLLKDGKSEAKFRKLLDERGPVYEAVSDFIIDTDDLNIKEIADKGGRLI